jgi:histone-binding protein RBBP4
VEDVDWHKFSPHLFGSVGDDRSLCLWDTRKSGENKAVEVVKNAHADDINCLQFNPLNEFLVATGGSDGQVNIWDIRNLRDKFHTLSTHTEGVYQTAWSPHSEFCLASGSADTRICCWDLSRVGEEQTKEQSEVGPPELVFIHGGHTAKISDLHWNPNRPWTFASVAEDNVMQVWQMTEAHYIRTSGGAGDGGAAMITDEDLEG